LIVGGATINEATINEATINEATINEAVAMLLGNVRAGRRKLTVIPYISVT